MVIVGVGLDDPEENLEWSEEEAFTFALWTDDDKVLGTTYDALDGERDTSVDRVTALLDADGNLVLQYLEDINIGTHPGRVLEDCEALFGN